MPIRRSGHSLSRSITDSTRLLSVPCSWDTHIWEIKIPISLPPWTLVTHSGWSHSVSPANNVDRSQRTFCVKSILLPVRIELTTSGLWDRRSTNWAKGAVHASKIYVHNTSIYNPTSFSQCPLHWPLIYHWIIALNIKHLYYTIFSTIMDSISINTLKFDLVT